MLGKQTYLYMADDFFSYFCDDLLNLSILYKLTEQKTSKEGKQAKAQYDTYCVKSKRKNWNAFGSFY